MQEVTLTTPYNEQGGLVEIVGNYWQGTDNKGILLLHMMPATKESWNTLAEKFNANGYHVLAIDLRGHGDSYQATLPDGNTTTLNYNNFSDVQHQLTHYDIQSGIDFLLQQGVKKEQLHLGGASIGANLILQYMGENHFVRKGFALSPGLDYRGIKTEKALENMFLDQQIFLTVAEDDKYPNHSVNVLSGVGEVQQTAKFYRTGGHGTDLFESHPELLNELISWIYH